MNEMRSNAEMAELIVKHLGGSENITGLYHCATRLRFTLKDKSKFDLDFLKTQPEILGAIQSGEESQVIIGGKVGEYFQAINKAYKLEENSDGQAATTEKNPFKRLINTLVGIMAPIITPLIGGGMFKVVVSLLTATGLVDKTSQNYVILNFMSDSVFYFLPFMLAVSAARKFKTNEFLAMALAGVLLHPTWSH
ncbi:beta-glucosides PTS, EIIBCA [Lactobacillus pasteurii DSM 23907 = CRBIP 24.76]|nr:beta-glucosides PTS, EIIBCA [Lactobacillus pasteurii DSM 23907 = CRBIP 24.76]